jgi:hypothetical protein
MIPLRIVEKDHEDFDAPIVEIWREQEFIGYVFWDEDLAVVQVYPDADGEPFDLELGDLLRVLDIAARIVGPEPDEEDPELATLSGRIAEVAADDVWGDEDHRVVELLREWDERAVVRDDDGEGFFARDDAEALIARCEGLDLAVVEVEGLDWNGRRLKALPDLHLVVERQPGTEWEIFRPQANATVATRCAAWPTRKGMVVSFVIQLPDGSTRVL